MEEEQVIYVVVDDNTNQAQQVQFINGQPQLVVQDENGQSAVLGGQQLLFEDENGEQMVIGGTSGGGQGQPMVVMEDGTTVLTSDGNFIQESLLTAANSGAGSKFILGPDGSLSLDSFGEVQSITPVTSTVSVPPPAPALPVAAATTKSHPKFVVTSSGLQIQGSQSPPAGTNGSPATSSAPPQQISLLRQAFNNASPEKPQFVSVTPQMAPQPPPPIRTHIPSATITIPAAKPILKPRIPDTSVSNGHSILVSTSLPQTVNSTTTVLAVPDPGPVPGPELMETDTLTVNTWESVESEETSLDQVEPQTSEADSTNVDSIPAAATVEISLPIAEAESPEKIEAEAIEFVASEIIDQSKPEAEADDRVDAVDEPAQSDTGAASAQDEVTHETTTTQEETPSLIINVKKLTGEEDAESNREQRTTTVVEAARVEESTIKGGLNDSTSSFKTGEYVGNSEDDDDPADYYQNVDPIDSYLTARDEEDGIPAESLIVTSPQKEPIDYESVFPSPQKADGGQDEESTTVGVEPPKRRGRPPKKSITAGASPRVSSASDSETPLSPSKRIQRQGRSIYRRPVSGSPDTSTSAQDVTASEDAAGEDDKPDSAGEEQEPAPEEAPMQVHEAEEEENAAVDEPVDMEVEASVAEASEESPVAEASEEAPVAEASEEAPVAEASEEAPVAEASEEASTPVTPQEVPKKRGRGRPRKSELIATPVLDQSELMATPVLDSAEESSQAEVVVEKTPARRRGRPPKKKSIEPTVVAPPSDADDSQTEEKGANFERVGANRGRGRRAVIEQPESAVDTSQSEELEEGEIDFRSQQSVEEFEPQPGTSREMSRTGRQRSTINYREMAGSTDADTASDPEDSEGEDTTPVPPAVRRGRPRKTDSPKTSPMKTYDMRKGMPGFSPVKTTGKGVVIRSPNKGAPLKMGEAFSPKRIGKDNKEWRGDLSSLRKEVEGLRSTNDLLQTKLEMTDQQVQSGDSKELHCRIEKLQSLNTELKNKLKEAESRPAGSNSAPKFSLNLGLFKGPKFDKFTVKKTGSSHNNSSSASGSDFRSDRPDGGKVLARQKDQLGAKNKDLKNKEAMLEKREQKARALDQELDDRSSQLKVKEAKLNRWEQKLKSHEKELEYRERNLGRSERADAGPVYSPGRKTGETEKKLREMLAKKDRLDDLEGKLKEREKALRANDTALKAFKKQVDGKERELNRRDTDLQRKEKGLQGKEDVLSTTEEQLKALGHELKEKYEYLQGVEQNLNTDGESADNPNSPVKLQGAGTNFEKEKDALLQKITDITDKTKSDRRKSMQTIKSESKAQDALKSPRGRGRPKKNGSPAVGRKANDKTTPGRPVTKASLASPASVSPRGRGRPRKDTSKTGESATKPKGKQEEAKGATRKLNKSEPSTLRLNRKRKASVPEPVSVTKRKKSI